MNNSGGTSLGGTLGGKGFGIINENLGQISTTQQAGGMVVYILSRVIGFLTVAASLWFLIQILIGGLSWISAGGEKNKLTEARDRLTNSFIGLVVVVAAWAILALMGEFFGIGFTNPAKILEQLEFK